MSGDVQTHLWPVPRCRVCGCPLLVWLRPEQVARSLQISQRQAYYLADRGQVRSSRIAGVVRMHHGSLHRYIDERAPDPEWWEWPEMLETE